LIGKPELNMLILSILPTEWDARVTARFIAKRIPGYSATWIASYIRVNLEPRYVETFTRLGVKIYRRKPGSLTEKKRRPKKRDAGDK
jgi:hypothetical protein